MSHQSGTKPTIEQADCTLCAGQESPGFFTGCMVRDCPEFENRDGWVCDGRGHLARIVSQVNNVETLIAPARELLTLYDLRPGLAEMEKCDMATWGKLQSDTKAALRQYGERKKAGWTALRAALDSLSVAGKKP